MYREIFQIHSSSVMGKIWNLLQGNEKVRGKNNSSNSADGKNNNRNQIKIISVQLCSGIRHTKDERESRGIGLEMNFPANWNVNGSSVHEAFNYWILETQIALHLRFSANILVTQTIQHNIAHWFVYTYICMSYK